MSLTAAASLYGDETLMHKTLNTSPWQTATAETSCLSAPALVLRPKLIEIRYWVTTERASEYC
jgi:hypothetical protein